MVTGELKRGEELLSDFQDQQKAAMAKVKELRQQRKQLMGKAAAEAETKRREQAVRTAARQRASVKTEKKQPVLHRVDRESQGGVYDWQWEKGEGVWVRLVWVHTACPPGRSTGWLEGRSAVTSVQEAKRRADGALGRSQGGQRAMARMGRWGELLARGRWRGLDSPSGSARWRCRHRVEPWGPDRP